MLNNIAILKSGFEVTQIQDNMLSRCHLIPEGHGRRDGQTDGRTDRIAISVARVEYADAQ